MIKWTGPDEFQPKRKYAGDAGYDLIVSEDTTIESGTFADVPCGICIEMPAGVWALLIGRSSTLEKRGLLVVQGVIDNGYRGPIYAGCQNIGDQTEIVHQGERIAQFIPMQLLAHMLQLEHVRKLGKSDRGNGSFGSTGP